MAGRPPGPTKLTPDVEARIIRVVRSGAYLETAAATAGIARQTLHDWLRKGARANLKKGRLTPAEQTLVHFSDAVERAQAEAEAADVTRLAQLAEGGQQVTTITEKVDGRGKVLERSTRTETLAPSAQVLQWRLERRFHDRWGRRSAVELTGPDGAPLLPDTAERADRLADEATLFLAGAAEGRKANRNGDS